MNLWKTVLQKKKKKIVNIFFQHAFLGLSNSASDLNTLRMRCEEGNNAGCEKDLNILQLCCHRTFQVGGFCIEKIYQS